MKLEDRREAIMELLVEQGSAGLDDLARCFGVSRMTIHRDLDDLAAAGLLRKVRGGATIEASSRFESDYRYRQRQAGAEKRLIAAYAARFVEPGMSVLVDDSSTAQALVPFLADLRPLTVITNGLAVMSGLAGQPGLTLVGLGGTYSRKFNGFFGLMAEEALDRLRADVALLSSSAIHGLAAFHQDSEVVGVKRRMLRRATRAYLMADHGKFGRAALHFVADLGAFAGVVTGPALAPATARALQEGGVALHMAETEDTA